MNYEPIRKLLFLLPGEASHHVSMQSLSLLEKLNLVGMVAREVPPDPVTVMGLNFPNPVGLAAGLDKDARAIDGLAALGFGFLEVGTVTPRPQPGNPRPRLFRLPGKQALINRMGFNNEGVEAMVARIQRAKYAGILGINIGKNFDTPVENALEDYLLCMQRVYSLASYIVVNISSPNTPGLRSLQHHKELDHLLDGLKQAHASLATEHAKHVPLLVKIAPDMDDDEVMDLVASLQQFEIDGVIVTNTTVSRSAVVGERNSDQAGGLSGAPLRNQANHVLKLVADAAKGKMGIIGVGGIMTGEDAAEKIRLGADLVQIYTGFIYQGPPLIGESAAKIREFWLGLRSGNPSEGHP
ncbi:MAG: quinone-dependent dihydroorotate dehydrogenase [Pseudomonadota bacterium]